MTIRGQEPQPDIESAREDLANGETTPLLNTSVSEASFEILRRDSNESYIYAASGEIRWMMSSSSLTTLTLMLQSSFFFVNVLA
ncbi:hypothetical protein H4217_008538, partial [Coemansia sp. RSA 1939]